VIQMLPLVMLLEALLSKDRHLNCNEDLRGFINLGGLAIGGR
jgi:hypothetical protein